MKSVADVLRTFHSPQRSPLNSASWNWPSKPRRKERGRGAASVPSCTGRPECDITHRVGHTDRPTLAKILVCRYTHIIKHCVRGCTVSGGTLCQGVHCVRGHTVSGGALCQGVHCVRGYTVSGGTLCQGVHCVRGCTVSGGTLCQGVHTAATCSFRVWIVTMFRTHILCFRMISHTFPCRRVCAVYCTCCVVLAHIVHVYLHPFIT